MTSDMPQELRQRVEEIIAPDYLEEHMTKAWKIDALLSLLRERDKEVVGRLREKVESCACSVPCGHEKCAEIKDSALPRFDLEAERIMKDV